MRPRPLPHRLAATPFTVRESGLTERRLRASDLDRSVWGVRGHPGRGADLLERCRLYSLRLGDSTFFTHTTAALLWDAPVPLSLDRRSLIHVSVVAPARAPHARGLAGHSLRIDPADIGRRRGLRVSSPARTWCDAAGILALDDLVALGDYFIHHASPLTSVAEIGGVLSSIARMRGARHAREALSLLDDRPESPQESKLRLIVLRSGLPEPVINHELVDSETGKEVRPDFLFEEHRVILEYQGDYHRTKSQWRKDMTRRSRLEAQGWFVMELNADDLKDPTELVARIQRVFAARASR